MRVILFGGSGFIGSHIAEQFSKDERCQLTLALRPGSSPATSFLDKLDANQCEVDFSQQVQLERAMAGRDMAVSCIASRQMHDSYDALAEVEVELTKRLLLAAAKAGVKRFLLLSTVMAYGFKRGAQAIDEEHPLSACYKFNRIAIAREKAAQELAEALPIELVIVRPCNTIGRRDSQMQRVYSSVSKGFFPVFRRQAVKFSGVDVRDIGRAFLFLAKQQELKQHVFLVKGFDTSWPDLAQTMQQQIFHASNCPLQARMSLRMPYLASGLMYKLAALVERFTPLGQDALITPFNVAVMASDCLFDASRIEALGFSPQYSLDEAVADFLSGLK